MFDRSQFDLDAPRVQFYRNTTRLYETDPTKLHEAMCEWCATQGWTVATRNTALHLCTQSGLAPVYRQKFHELQAPGTVHITGVRTDKSPNAAKQPTTHLIDAGAQRVVMHDDKDDDDGGGGGGGGARVVVYKPFLVLPDSELEQGYPGDRSPYGMMDRSDSGEQHAETGGTGLELRITLTGTGTLDVKWLGPHRCATADGPPPERSGCLYGFRMCGMPAAGAVGIPLLTSILVFAALLLDRG